MQANLELVSNTEDLEMPETITLELTTDAVKTLYYWKAWVTGSEDLHSVSLQSHKIFADIPEEYGDLGRVGTDYIAVYEHGFYYVMQNKYDSNLQAEYEIKIGSSTDENIQHE